MGASRKKAVGEVFGGEYDNQPTKSGKNNRTQRVYPVILA
jgi:hypothetical protein